MTSHVLHNPERIDLKLADDPRDVVHRVVECLARGGIAALPAETSYKLAVHALHPEAVARLSALRGGGAGSQRAVSLVVRGAEELPDWIPGVSEIGRRLSRRCWPGPLTLTRSKGIEAGLAQRLPETVRAVAASEGMIHLRCPAAPLILEVARLLAGPLLLAGAGAGAESTPVLDPEALAEREGIDLLVDAGVIAPGTTATVLNLDREPWTLVREGAITAAELTRRSATRILFICTGNTCRSPMAQALCQVLLGERLGCAPGAIAQRGWVVASAGVAATDGDRAARHAVDVVRRYGGSLDDHASQGVSAELVRQSDLILAMTRDHLDALLEAYPEAAARARPLHGAGLDIADPVGGDRETYLQTAEALHDEIARLLDTPPWSSLIVTD